MPAQADEALKSGLVDVVVPTADAVLPAAKALALAVGGEVVFGDLQGYVHFVARDSGAFLARAATDGSKIRAAPLRLPNGAVLVQTLNGGLFAVSL